MGKPLRALFVEDVEDDALLALRELRRGGYDVEYERVETGDELSRALDGRRWDILISDYFLPAFDALAALEILRARKLDIPFIIVSGTVGEETAVEAIRAGAQDFLVKGKFARFIPVVERELRDASLRTERARMQEQLLISERMASMGTLAAGVAHEINNPLTIVVSNLELIAADVERAKSSCAAANDLARIERSLADAREAAERVRVTVAELKLFSRMDEETVGAVDIHRVIQSSLRMAATELRHRARVVLDFEDVPRVRGNEGRLRQVFLNLLINAAHAMPEGKATTNEIRISTRVGAAKEVVIDVRDTGTGIPEEILPRIFDPFFTTKPVGVGTGLGLSICHRIISEHSGGIAVESRVGEGTLFRTTLPGTTGPVSSAPRMVAAEAKGRRGRILVVDDEPTLGTVIKMMLSPEHDVTVVRSAHAAMSELERDDAYDVILCDLMMPEMTGMDLYDALRPRALRLAERMVFMTGGAFGARAHEFLKQVPNRRVDKPFDGAKLRSTLRDLIR